MHTHTLLIPKSDDHLWSKKSWDLQMPYQIRQSERKVIPSQDKTAVTSVCLCVCFCWTHMFVCPWAQRTFEPQELIPPIRISVRKRGQIRPSARMAYRRHTHALCARTHTIRKSSTRAPHQLSHPFLWFLLFQVATFSSPLIRDNWSLSEILKPITFTSHCWHSNPLQSCPSHCIQPHPFVFPPSLPTSVALLNPFSIFTRSLLNYFQEFAKPLCYFFGWVWSTESREGKFLGFWQITLGVSIAEDLKECTFRSGQMVAL